MSIQRISALLSLSLLSSPIVLSGTPQHQSPSSSVRSAQRSMKYRLAEAPQLQPMGTYVGELQERWQFPSDHLPIGMTLDGIHITSWNVLDADYMSWVTEKDSQGLKRSLIAEEHVYIGDSQLTVRDRHVVQLLTAMISHPTHPRSLLSLQECNQPFLAELRSALPSHFTVIAHGGEAVVIDQNQFEIVDAKAIEGIYSVNPARTFQDITLRRLDTQETMRILNAHVPGDPQGPARYEFAQYLAKTHQSMTTVAMGDMNFNELEMADAVEQAFQQSPYTIYSPYCTNISVKQAIEPLTTKAIDHFLVSTDKKGELLSAEEVLLGLEETYQLLNPLSAE